MLPKKASSPLGKSLESMWSDYFSDIFRDATEKDGAVCLFSDKNRQKCLSYTKASQMYLRGGVELSRHDRRDAFFSFASYNESPDMFHNTENIANIYAWSIDVDYTRSDLHPLDVLQYILDEVDIPCPNYAEYGHRLRLIYLFEEPLRLIPGRKKKLLAGFRFLQTCVATLINEQIDWACAEGCPATSFFRVPGSINSKTNTLIQIKHLTDERLTLQEVFEEWIPKRLIDASGNADKWLLRWKEKTKNKQKPKFTTIRLWERRLETFRTLRENFDVQRELLCFLYGVGCLWTGKAKTIIIFSLVYNNRNIGTFRK